MERRVVIVTGVSGSGKTTIGTALANIMGAEFHDGDDFHPAANVEKMSAGIPLTDDDREPWLKAISKFISERYMVTPVVIACSALKEKYRKALAANLDSSSIQWVHLQGSYDLIYQRMQERKEHFMGAAMLSSQFEAYEKPAQGLIVNVDQALEQIVGEIMKEIKGSDVGLIGLGVMGTSLARNIASKGFSISIFNRHVAGKEEDVARKMANRYEELSQAKAFDDLSAFVGSLKRPRKIILMVNAGRAVDDVIKNIIPLLEQGDVLVDGGNSHYRDTETREKALAEQGIHFIGSGVSGGEEGALKGPSIMPGGSPEGWKKVKDVLMAIAAKNEIGEICCDHIGKGGAGHFVKMVHNGIEYAEMQLISECYSHLRYDQGKTVADIASIFEEWNNGDAGSYLMGITVDILRFKDADGSPLIDKISDVAGNKGTGSWTAMTAAELGIPVPAIAEALFARYVSSFKKDRLKFAAIYGHKTVPVDVNTEDLRIVYMFARIMNHRQGMSLIREASAIYDWEVDASSLLRIWSGGCIIRSALLAMLRKDTSDDILEHPYVVDLIQGNYERIRNTVAEMLKSDQGYPVLSSCLEYFKLMSTGRNSSYLLQAQRDYFGAHTYQRTDDPSGQAHHTQWYYNKNLPILG